MSAPLPISSRLLNAVKLAEGFRSRSYLDARGVWTIGYGHTSGVKEGDTITEPEALLDLRAELTAFQERIVEALALRNTFYTPGQLDALTDFAYNVGFAALINSTLMIKFRSGDLEGASAEFARWNQVGERVLPGLVQRRAMERTWFDEPVRPGLPVSA